MLYENLITIAIMYGLVILSNIAYLLQSYLLNHELLEQTFDIRRFFKGLIESITQAIVFLIIAFNITLLPSVLARVNISLPQDILNVFNLITVVLLLGSLIVKYTTQTIEKFKLTKELEESDIIYEEY